MNPPDRLLENLESVRSAIDDACRRSGRVPDSVTLVAVTKRRSIDLARRLLALGVTALGENYPRELWEKADDLADGSVRWHLIGHLQGNKLARTAPLVHMIHSVDSLKLLRALNSANLPAPPQVCLQVNCSGEASKHGWSPLGLIADAEEIARCPHVPIVGLMTMAPLGTNDESARPSFVLARELRGQLAERSGLALPHLSMGMSGDFRAAIEEGATLVRIGSALFEGLDP
jgi:PLP dependent protein